MEPCKIRADAVRNREAVLVAADELFAQSQAPRSVSMDDIAAHAGVGKGTLFRRFGDRTGLINAVYTARTAHVHQAVCAGPPPLGPDTPPRERIPAILDAMLQAKLDNRHLSLALEDDASCEGPCYSWIHDVIADALRQLPAPGDPNWTAHALLATIRADLVERLLEHEHMTARQIRAQLEKHVEAVLGVDDRSSSNAGRSPVGGKRLSGRV